MTTRVETPERVLNRLDWQVIRRLDGRLQGNYRTIFRGVGTDFHDLREYEPGDDVRHIDWNVTARMDTPFLRQYVEDRELTAWLLLGLIIAPVIGLALPSGAAIASYGVLLLLILLYVLRFGRWETAFLRTVSWPVTWSLLALLFALSAHQLIFYP